MKSGNINFLEPSGPLRACNGTDLPFSKELEEYFVNLTEVQEVRRAAQCSLFTIRLQAGPLEPQGSIPARENISLHHRIRTGCGTHLASSSVVTGAVGRSWH